MKFNDKEQTNRRFRGISIGVFVAFQSAFSWMRQFKNVQARKKQADTR
jgi:putative aminopeptidase FrvX